jgi:hypothetical protein
MRRVLGSWQLAAGADVARRIGFRGDNEDSSEIKRSEIVAHGAIWNLDCHCLLALRPARPGLSWWERLKATITTATTS